MIEFHWAVSNQRFCCLICAKYTLVGLMIELKVFEFLYISVFCKPYGIEVRNFDIRNVVEECLAFEISLILETVTCYYNLVLSGNVIHDVIRKLLEIVILVCCCGCPSCFLFDFVSNGMPIGNVDVIAVRVCVHVWIFVPKFYVELVPVRVSVFIYLFIFLKLALLACF